MIWKRQVEEIGTQFCAFIFNSSRFLGLLFFYDIQDCLSNTYGFSEWNTWVIATPRYIYLRSCINSFSFKIIFMLLVRSSETLSLRTAEHQDIFDMQALHGHFSQLSLMATTLPFRVVLLLETYWKQAMSPAFNYFEIIENSLFANISGGNWCQNKLPGSWFFCTLHIISLFSSMTWNFLPKKLESLLWKELQ